MRFNHAFAHLEQMPGSLLTKHRRNPQSMRIRARTPRRKHDVFTPGEDRVCELARRFERNGESQSLFLPWEKHLAYEENK